MRFAAMGVALVAVVALTGVSGPAHAAYSCSTVPMLDHRGDTTPYSENTLPALRASFDAGYGVETDVSKTADDDLVLHHDRSLVRTTTGWGLIDERTTTYVRSLLTDSGEPAQVPFLTEALAMLAEYPAATLLLEVKPYGGWSVRQLTDLEATATAYGVHNQVIFWSPGHTFLDKMRTAMGDDAQIAWKAPAAPTPTEVAPANWAGIVPRHLTASYADGMRASGVQVLARNARPSEVATVTAAGADMVLTNQPELVVC